MGKNLPVPSVQEILCVWSMEHYLAQLLLLATGIQVFCAKDTPVEVQRSVSVPWYLPVFVVTPLGVKSTIVVPCVSEETVAITFPEIFVLNWFSYRESGTSAYHGFCLFRAYYSAR
jgi:hypothetical protein